MFFSYSLQQGALLGLQDNSAEHKDVEAVHWTDADEHAIAVDYALLNILSLSG